MKFTLLSFLLLISTPLLKAEECSLLREGELDELTTAVCKASTDPEIAVDKEEKQRFEKKYYNKEYQNQMIRKGATNEERTKRLHQPRLHRDFHWHCHRSGSSRRGAGLCHPVALVASQAVDSRTHRLKEPK